jgi:signal transduction histidine kinase
MGLGLRQKLFGGYLVVISILVAIAGFGAVTLHELLGDYRRLVETAIPTQRALYGLEEVFRLQTANERKFYVVGSPTISGLFDAQNTEWDGLIADLARLTDAPGVRDRLSALSQAHGTYLAQANANMDALEGARAEDPEALARTTQPLIDEVVAETKAVTDLVRATQETTVAETQVRADSVVSITVILGLITLAIGLTAAWVLSILLTRPVRRLRAATEEIALGIFDRRVPVASRDEIGDLAASFNRMAEKLAALDQVREEFVTYVSHELRTPLTSLKEANSLLLDGLAGRVNTRQRQLLDIVQEDCLKIERLINELLDLSKMEAGMMHLQREPTWIGRVVAAAEEEMHPVAAKRDIAVEVAAGPDQVVDADPGRIRQVVTNLVSNAIKFSPEGSRVRVSWQVRRLPAGEALVCAVADQGPGIPEAAREAIFEKFHQLAPSALSALRGTGLGLPISRKIVEAHGGALWVECPPEGGSVFRFSLPLSPVPAAALKPASTEQVTA